MSSNSCGGDSSFEKNRQNRAPTANPSSIAEFLARLFYFFRAFERSCFRDGFSLFSPGTRNHQEDHENTKGRKHEKTPPSRTLLRYLPYLLFKILLLVPGVFTRHEIWCQSLIEFDRLRLAPLLCGWSPDSAQTTFVFLRWVFIVLIRKAKSLGGSRKHEPPTDRPPPQTDDPR